MTFTFTQQIEATQNEIAQLQAKLDTYSKTDDYLTQSEELLHQVTNAGFKEKDLQIVRSRLQEVWDIECSYDSTSELEDANSLIVELQNKVKSLETSLETALEQRDRSTKKYTELLRQSINSSPEVEFLDTFHELCTDDESPQELEELESRDIEVDSEEVYDQPPTPVPLDLRVKDFIKSFKDDSTTWDDLKGFALNDPKFFQKLTMARSTKLGRIKEALPKMLANHIEKHGSSDKAWVGKTLWGLAEKELKTRYQQAKNTPELTVEDALREKTLDWEREVEKVVEDLLSPQSFNSVTVKRISRDLFARYPDNLEAIASKLFELLKSSNSGSVVYVWVEDAYKEYQKNTLEDARHGRRAEAAPRLRHDCATKVAA